MVDAIDSPNVTTTANIPNSRRVSFRLAGACLCTAVSLIEMLSFASFSAKPISLVSSKENISFVSHSLTNAAPKLVYTNDNMTIFSTGLGDASLNTDARSYVSLNKISLLKDNWDGDGAPAFSTVLIERCRTLVKTLLHQPEIFPTARKSIQFEWDNPFGDYLEIEFYEDDRCEMALRRDDGSWTEKEIDYSEIDKHVEEFFTRTV